MNKLNGFFFSVTILLILSGCYGKQEIAYRNIVFSSPQADTVRVMTFNIRANNILDSLDSWYFRKQRVFVILADNSADVIGLQEARYSQLQQIQQALPQYSYYAAGRYDGMQSGESCPIFYRKDRFAVLDSGTFWFSDTPDVPGTLDWGNIVPRICSWVHLLEREQKTSFYVYNLHLDCFSQNSREKSVRLLARQVAERKTQAPFIVMGDFNMALYNPAMMYLMKFGYQTPYPKMVDAWLSVYPDQSEASTCQRFRGWYSGPNIDHIQICEDARALEATIDSRDVNGRYASDHFPVIADILLTSPRRVSQLNNNQVSELLIVRDNPSAQPLPLDSR